jgi:hypothetical protein
VRIEVSEFLLRKEPAKFGDHFSVEASQLGTVPNSPESRLFQYGLDITFDSRTDGKIGLYIVMAKVAEDVMHQFDDAAVAAAGYQNPFFRPSASPWTIL